MLLFVPYSGSLIKQKIIWVAKLQAVRGSERDQCPEEGLRRRKCSGFRSPADVLVSEGPASALLSQRGWPHCAAAMLPVLGLGEVSGHSGHSRWWPRGPSARP